MDRSLRNLRRAWLETRAVEAEARYLRERLRLGELTRERLELCAWLGHAPAVQALDGRAPAGQHVPWATWAAQLDPAGQALVVGELLALTLRGVSADALPEALATAARALRDWCACPCEEHLGNVADTQEAAAAAADELLDRIVTPRHLGRMLRLSSLVGDLVFHEHLGRERLDWLCLDDEFELGQGGTRLVAWALGSEHGLTRGSGGVSAGDEAAFLLQRLREGELSLERLRLAAYAEHRPAQLALEGAGEPLPASPDALAPWLVGLRAWGQATAVRGVLTALDTFVHTEVAGDGVLGRLWATLAARGPLREAQELITGCWDPIFEGRSQRPEPDTRERLEQAARRIEAHAAASLRLRLVPGLRQRLHTWASALRVSDDLERAAAACAELDATFEPISPRWRPIVKAREAAVEEALSPPSANEQLLAELGDVAATEQGQAQVDLVP